MTDFPAVAKIGRQLKARLAKADDPASVLRSRELKDLLSTIADQPKARRAAYGAAVNQLKAELIELAAKHRDAAAQLPPIDVTAPFDANVPAAEQPTLLSAEDGSVHPVTAELNHIKDIFARMGFAVSDSRLLDDDYHMFGSLNFPKDHPARDDYDTFMTEEGLILPAHTSTMQNRVMEANRPPIAVVIPGRVFRNEDLDATHEHTFHQVEGVYVDKGVALADMLGTIKAFLEAYFEQAIEYKTQPFYFPFVEPGLEYLIKMPKSLQKDSGGQWLEIMGCGLIHPNVLKEAGLDPQVYSGFAWGMGLERLIMLKYGIEDVRHFMSGRLDFLKRAGGTS
jgi:phenylalanyl-tRNA synthetase alpha chain